MFKKLILVMSLMAIVFLLTANTLEERELHRSKVLQTQREMFDASKSCFRRMPSNLTTTYQIDEVVTQFTGWDEETWINDQKMKQTYGNDGNISTILWSYWDEDGNEWIPPIDRGIVHWYADGLIDRIVRQMFFWDEEEWIDLIIFTNQYNELNQIESITMEIYDFEGDEFVQMSIISFTYDTYDILKTITFVWLYEDWASRMEESRVHFTYDNRGRIVELLDEEFIDDEWVNIYKSFIEHHHSDDSGYEVVQNFVNNFSLFMVRDFIIDELPYGKPEIETMWEWSEYEEEWMLDDRFIYHYDEDDYLVKVEFEIYDFWDEEWFKDEQHLYYYDERRLITEIVYMWVDWEEPDEWINYHRSLISYIETSSVEEDYSLPEKVRLKNYPNPFNPETTIVFNLPADNNVSLNIYNSKGQLVKNLVNDRITAGEHRVVWNGQDDRGSIMTSGVYFYRLESETETLSGRMLMIK